MTLSSAARATRTRLPSVPAPVFRQLCYAAAILLGAIVVTGGFVRLTGSGLGCPTWPRCTSTSFVAPTSYHALVEFVNRMVTTAVGIFIGLVAASSLLLVEKRRDLSWLSWSLVAGFFGQAVVGGLSVLYHLSPPWIMAHFLLSMLMLWAAILLVRRSSPTYESSGPVVHRTLLLLSNTLIATAGGVLFLGTVTTGTGPHAGAPNVTRLPFPLERVTQLHADSALFLTGLVVATLFAVRLTPTTALIRRRVNLLAISVFAQVVIGYTQYFLNLPASVVELHIAGATLLWAATIGLRMSMTTPEPMLTIDLADQLSPSETSEAF